MTNQTEFSIVYGGDAYSDNQIDARTLGNALSSLASLIEHSDKLLNGENATPKLTIKAHKEGSFEVICEAIGISVNTLQALGLATGSATAIASIWSAIEMLKGKVIAEIIVDKQKGTSKLIVDDEVIECTEDVKKLVTSPIIRQEIDKLVYQPLQTNNSSTFNLKTSDQTIRTEVTKNNVINFKKKSTPVLKTIEYDDEELNVNFAKVNFSSVRGWSIILPDNTHLSVAMNDESFLERVNKNETRFSKDDLFVVSLRTETVKEDDKIVNTSYSIERVLRHRAAQENKII